ncbi:Hypothetical protein PHPALM_13337, partial [Phytophthora palmivora]
VMPSLEDPFRSLVVKWMELDIPFNSTGLIKNRDYIYLEGIGIVKNAAGERFGYSLLHSVNFPQTHALPNRVRGNISFIAYWRQINSNTMEMYATGIIDPVDDGLVRKLVLPVVATLFLGSLDYAYCGQMRKLSFMLERRYAESKTRGAPNKKSTCVTCSAPITGRRLGDFGKSNSTCKLCFGFVCHACKIVRKLTFVDPDLQMTQRKVTFCTGCISEVTSMSAIDIARAKAPNKKSTCVTCSAPITGRRLGDFGKSNSTCKLCFGFVCHACKIVRKLTFVDPDLQMTQRKVTFCTGCISEVTSMSAIDIARAKLLSMKSDTNSSGATGYSSSSNLSDISYCG